MPNHVHLIVVPEQERAMAQALGRTHADYARHYNFQQRTCGHVWQARYYSTPLDSNHLWRAMAYIERNPVRARLVRQAEEYAWSSAREREGRASKRQLVDVKPWTTEYDWTGWKLLLATTVEDEAFGLRLQDASRRGRPLGSEAFTTALESRCGRRLRPMPVGRPRKSEPEEGNQLALGYGV